ncbi:uncharacterized protein LOC123266355 isoform X2 [Cotesia glomerata]|uniref:uncharacterized protein LOC123266355 isoform X2 n=1 Tax=Cotesia glomerata TaxID=32391 RepID=UPI001D017AE1|nr:uncharacterized protein LOC123266355 isoform X2 [Cotesia glomerata]
MTIASNIVVEWLRSLHLCQYSESFIDNGYDDLEICKQIGDPDLDAIGVFNLNHRMQLLQSVKTLREEGAASVYFTLEETNDCICDSVSLKSSKTSSEPLPSDKEIQRVSPTASLSSGGQELAKFADEYEEGKAELVRIPKLQLQILLQEKLRHDGIRLACQPYTTPEGEQGYLEGLASKYADIFQTHYGDVLEPLEELRQRETNTSSKISNTQLTTSFSQPIYVPGKYSPSSCLSDKEEDEIYGFGYGVFGRQMLQQRQQKLIFATQNNTFDSGGHQQTYHSCLSPRSAFFYEFPPNEQDQNTNKKKTTFSRLLKGLKTHKKEKQNQAQASPKHSSHMKLGVPQRIDTPDSVLQSGLDLGPEISHAVLRSMVDPKDYDRLRYFQMNSGQSNSFEETIHRILRDIRQGLMQLNCEGQNQPPKDDTYMYDEDARCGGFREVGTGGQHWYDEPPYESDPEDFLMGACGGPVPTATIQNGRICFTLDLRPDNRGEEVISLRTAGDISVPRDRSKKTTSTTMRGLIVPRGHNNPPAIIPLTHSKVSRESGDYASSDIQSRSSDDEGLSPNQSSDFEDQQEFMGRNSSAIHGSETRALLDSNGARTGIVGHAKNLRYEVQKKITKLRQDRASSDAFPCNTSSVESLPSGSGSSTQALVRADSNHSSISCDDRDAVSPTPIGPILCRARAIVDYTPSPYDKDALNFKKGDVINVVQMNKSGLWKGITHNRIGFFKFINVEILNERVPRCSGELEKTKWNRKSRHKPRSVQELLQRMNLQEHIPVFVLNGYEDLELFRELEPADLDYLRIHQPEHRAKILTAVQLLHDLQSESEGDLASSSEGDDNSRRILPSCQTSGHCSPFTRRQPLRDSGCYDTHKTLSRKLINFDVCKLNRENNFNMFMSANKCTDVNILSEGGCKDDYHPNIPSTVNNGGIAVKPKEESLEKTTQPCNISGNIKFVSKCDHLSETVLIKNDEQIVATPVNKTAIFKYNIGSSNDGLVCESVNAIVSLGQKGCFSEKSSDSGVSSSSISSAPLTRDNKTIVNTAVDPSTKNLANFTRGSFILSESIISQDDR